MSAQWADLFRDIETSLGEDPASEKAQALAARWRALVEQFTGGNSDITAGLKNAWADRQNWPDTRQKQSEPFSDPRVWEFTQKAMRCAQSI